MVSCAEGQHSQHPGGEERRGEEGGEERRGEEKRGEEKRGEEKRGEERRETEEEREIITHALGMLKVLVHTCEGLYACWCTLVG